jgi:signal transduction histidine kinase
VTEFTKLEPEPMGIPWLLVWAADWGDGQAPCFPKSVADQQNIQAAYGRGQRVIESAAEQGIESVRGYLEHEGSQAALRMALVVDLFAALQPDPPIAFDQRLMPTWRHCVGVAHLAEKIAERPSAFLGGLLHNVGSLWLAGWHPKSYARFLDSWHRTGAASSDAERDFFGRDQVQIGGRIASRWQLPEWASDCMTLHAQEAETIRVLSPYSKLVLAVRAADIHLRPMGMGGSDYDVNVSLGTAFAESGANDENIVALAKDLVRAVDPCLDLLTFAYGPKKIINELGILRTFREPPKPRPSIWKAASFPMAADADEDVVSVLHASAEELRNLLAAERVLLLAQDGQERPLVAGCAPPSKPGEGRDSLEHHVTPPDGDDWATLREVVADRFVRASPEAERLWRRFHSDPLDGRIWMRSVSPDTSTPVCLLTAWPAKFPGVPASEEEISWHLHSLAKRLAAEKRRSTLRQSQEELLRLFRQSREGRMDEVGRRALGMVAEMAGGLAHELNNPLAVISGRAQMELLQAPDGKHHRCLAVIVEQARRASQIVDDLMAFAKPETPEPILQPLSAVLAAGVARWKTTFALGENQLLLTLQDESATVYADRGQLDEILDALVGNAVAAQSGPARRIVVNSKGRASDERAWIEIEDRGPGMAAGVRDHATAPFFSSREAGRGRGLGLSRAARLAEINGGRLRLHSVPGHGTIAAVAFPARPSDAVSI